MAKKQFKAESKRLMDLMIHSIYTNREIFLRELISNASDALDKLYYQSLNDNCTGVDRSEFMIRLAADKENRLLTLTDNGIGMTKEELENNLGTIAKSGSFAFKQDNEEKPDVDIIGQFGVGFYSAFMVSDRVTVTSRAFGSDEAWCWESSGADGYTVTPAEKAEHGTEIVLHIKEDTEEEKYSEFLETYRLRGIVKKYSDYIRYPIKMDVEKSRLKEGCPEDKPEYETYTEEETVNSMVPLWRRNKNELKDEDYQQFYKDNFFDYEPALRVIHSATEGAATYHALMFIPAHAPYDYYTRDFQKGLRLYANGVLIMDKCADLLPDHFGFVRGLVDSQDLSLNISREMLQQDRQLKIIAGRLEKKIASELTAMLQNDRENYEKMWAAFGQTMKFGVYGDYGAHKDELKDLLLFVSSKEKKPVTLKEYRERMPEEQKYIYYACAETADKAARLPQTEPVLDRGYEVLYFTDDVDEFAIRMMRDYDGKEFRNVSAGDLGFEPEEPTEEDKAAAEENKELFAAMTEALSGKVKEVRASKRLRSHPVCLSSDGELTLEMERVLNTMPGDNKVKAERVLEINEAHPIFAKLKAQFAAGGKEAVADYAALLYDQALLMEGMSVEDPVAFAEKVCALLAQ